MHPKPAINIHECERSPPIILIPVSNLIPSDFAKKMEANNRTVGNVRFASIKYS